MFGRKIYAAGNIAADRENSALAETGFSAAAFSGFGKLLPGTRRHNLFYADDLQATAEPEGVRFSFTLPAGSYATVLLQELMKCANVDDDEAES
jgi:tRNA pseudouridine13 synthase